MLGLAIFLVIGGWLLVYTGFTNPKGDVRDEIISAFSGKGGKR